MENFTQVKGQVLVWLRENGHFALYSSASDLWCAKIENKRLTVFSPTHEADFLKKYTDILEEAFYQATGKNFEIIVVAEEKPIKKSKAEELKDFFGEKLKIK